MAFTPHFGQTLTDICHRLDPAWRRGGQPAFPHFTIVRPPDTAVGRTGPCTAAAVNRARLLNVRFFVALGAKRKSGHRFLVPSSVRHRADPSLRPSLSQADRFAQAGVGKSPLPPTMLVKTLAGHSYRISDRTLGVESHPRRHGRRLFVGASTGGRQSSRIREPRPEGINIQVETRCSKRLDVLFRNALTACRRFQPRPANCAETRLLPPREPECGGCRSPQDCGRAPPRWQRASVRGRVYEGRQEEPPACVWPQPQQPARRLEPPRRPHPTEGS